MEEKLTIKEKIFTFLEYKGIKKVDFFDATGISDSNFKGKNLKSQLGGDMIVKILTIYPDLSAEWLLTGRGSMLKETPENNNLSNLEVVKSHKPKYIEKQSAITKCMLIDIILNIKILAMINIKILVLISNFNILYTCFIEILEI